MKCFFNSQTIDGKCSGALLKIKYPECEMYGLDSARDFHIPEPLDTVYLVGTSFPFEWMAAAFSKLKGNLKWIDRVKTPAETWNRANPQEQINTELLRDRIGSCFSVFHHINGDAITPDFVKLISQFDVQDYSDSRTVHFQYGLLAIRDSDPERNMTLWNLLFDENYVKEIITAGARLLEMVSDSPVYMADCGFDVEKGWMKGVPR